MLEPPHPTTEREYLIRIFDAVNALRSDVQDLTARVNAQNGRIGKLEQWRGAVAGRLAVASAGAGVVGSLVGYVARGLLAGGP